MAELVNMTLWPSEEDLVTDPPSSSNFTMNNETSMNTTDVTTQHNVPVPAVSIPEAVIMSLLMSLAIAVTIVGNILVILSVFTYTCRPLRSVQNFFIVSLAVADTAVAILVMPFNVADFVIGHWVFGAVWCNIWLTSDTVFSCAQLRY